MGENEMKKAGRFSGHLGGSLLVGDLHHLTESRVGVDFRGELTHALAPGDGIGHLLDQIGGVKSVDVRSQHFTTGFVEQQLHQTVAIEFSQGFGIGLEVANGTELEAVLLGRALASASVRPTELISGWVKVVAGMLR